MKATASFVKNAREESEDEYTPLEEL